MARRHEALVSLSHDHHHGLAMALRLQQGEKALLNDGWTHDPFEQRNRVRRFFREELQKHFSSEEEFLFPAMRRTAPDAGALLDGLTEDHRDIASMIGRLEATERDDLRCQLAAIGARVEKHIRVEERTLFPMCEARLSHTDLETLEREFRSLRERV